MKARSVSAVDRDRFPARRALAVGGVHYRLGHQIGVGAFSTVFAGRDEWGNDLAVKIYQEDAEAGLWRNEVAQLRRFRSPQVPFLHAAFEHEGLRYLVMERCGIAAGRCGFEGAARRDQACRLVARGLLQVLHAIHAAAHLHGDVNPQNVLVMRSRQKLLTGVKLADFAFCRPLADKGRGIGKMAQWVPPPEHYDPARGPVGSAIDIWHAGLVLLQVLLGQALDYDQDAILAGRPRQDALAAGTPLALALAPALATAPGERPGALALWRAIAGSAVAQAAPDNLEEVK